MAASLTKQEIVMFDQLVDGFDDMLVIAKGAENYPAPNPQDMSRARDQFWIPAPMIGRSYDGTDATGHFGDVTQLNVPVNVGNHKHSSKSFSSYDLRNEYALGQWGKSAKQKLASDVNLSILNTVALQGANFIKRTTSATGFDDVAEADARFTEIGVPQGDRLAFFAPRVMNAMAGNLASRAEATTRSQSAYEKAKVASDIAGFEVYKLDQSINLAAAGGGATTVNGANQKTVPASTTVDATYGENNKDNRYTDLVITATTYANIKVGDAFTIAGVNSVNMITKQDTGQLQTFRVVGKPAANTVRIYPAIVFGTSDAEVEYQTVTALPANGANITWLNTAAAPLNTFFRKEALLLVPGSFVVENGAGVISVSATTDLGIQIIYSRTTNLT
ncbi:MAG: hypothetical protein KGP14_11525, partial [Betaproteobacteria bacterium]|nr:hypothetical protein [Betaproteobacteria bacterium]